MGFLLINAGLPFNTFENNRFENNTLENNMFEKKNALFLQVVAVNILLY